jgi:hypothetical protein
MIAAIHDEPEFSELFMSHLLTRNGRIEEDLIDQLFNSSESAWPGFFFSWQISARKAGRSRSLGKFSQEMLAEMIGTTRSRVSFFMNRSGTMGFIDYNRPHRGPQLLLTVILQDQPQPQPSSSTPSEVRE